MKIRIYLGLLVALLGFSSFGQQQLTGNGNVQRQSRYQQYGPTDATVKWENSLPGCFLTMPSWYYDGKVYFSRYFVTDGSDLDPSQFNQDNLHELFKRSDAVSEVYCFDLETGTQIFETSFGQNFIIQGFQDDLIYVMDYTGGAGSNYMWALNAQTGEMEWQFPQANDCSIAQSVVYAPNGDFIFPGPNTNNGIQRVARADGSPIWELPMQRPITGTGHISLNKAETVAYTWWGWFNTTADLVALDIETGTELYRRTIPTVDVQQTLILAGPDNRVFIQPRGFAGLICYQDTGFGFDSLWTAPDVMIDFGFQLVLNKDNSIIAQKDGKLVLLDYETGAVLNQASEVIPYGAFAGVDLSGQIFVVFDYPSNLYCYSPDLVLQYQLALGSGAGYSNGVPGPDGILVVTKTNKVTAYQTDQSNILFAPIDFVANVDIETNLVSFNWSEPFQSAFNLEGYNIYKNGEKINTSLIADTFFTYTENSNGNFHYYATTQYTSGESDAGFYDFLAIEAVVANITGMVTELATDEPIEGAEINIGPHQTFSAADGSFEINWVSPETYDVIIEAHAYNIYNEEWLIEPGETVFIDAKLTAPDLDYSFDEIHAELTSGSQEDYILNITNNGNGPADWDARVFYDGIYKKGNLLHSSGAGKESDVNLQLKPKNVLKHQVRETVQFSYDMSEPTGLGGIISVETDGLNFYVVPFNSDEIFKFSLEGELLETFYIPGVSDLRDLAWDGTYFYAGKATNQILIMDFINRELIGSFSVSSIVRSIAYDAGEDGFWVNDWATDLKLFSREGVLLNAIPGVDNLYGSAYDNVSEGGPYLWLFASPESGTCYLEQWEIASKSPTGVVIAVSDELGYCNPGGLFMAANLIPNTLTLGGIAQGNPDVLFGINAGEMENWIIPADFEGTIEAGETYKLTITIDALAHQSGESLKGSLKIIPQPEVGIHTVDITLDIILGLASNQIPHSLIYPNPAENILNFDIENLTSLKLFNLSGQCVYDFIGNENQLMIDVSNLVPGIYFAKIVTGNLTEGVKIMIK
jgi:type IX secretion system substrate protein/carboxypeptidase family protein/putative pyrroloquinoline-quinone binding quinoprotein